MATNQTAQQGFHAFLADVNRRVAEASKQEQRARDFILASAERYAYICVHDALPRPIQFLKQIAGRPPVCFGTAGFRPSIVDDDEPARHYTAFVFVGYWLPLLLAVPVLWAWEVLGLVRYGHWSQPDVRSGMIGIRHGRAMRRAGYAQWPNLIQHDLRG